MYEGHNALQLAELEYRRERMRAQYGVIARRRNSRRARRLPTARRSASHHSDRLLSAS